MTVMTATDYGHVLWWCPGCKDRHAVPVKQLERRTPLTASMPESGWDWNESLESPTLSPSVLVFSRGTLIDNTLPWGTEEGQLMHPSNHGMTPRCHSFIRDGHIEFLGDCGHELADHVVQMVDLDALGV